MNNGKERIQFKQLLRGGDDEDPKDAAELLVVGREVSETHIYPFANPQLAEFGRVFGDFVLWSIRIVIGYRQQWLWLDKKNALLRLRMQLRPFVDLSLQSVGVLT